jgi:hypothetical protein
MMEAASEDVVLAVDMIDASWVVGSAEDVASTT